jgi:hypothetical protein
MPPVPPLPGEPPKPASPALAVPFTTTVAVVADAPTLSVPRL